ncbi:hypothetical protein F5X97DRAFT_323859 [Nemania serpens]|nr:hypothetical protein F5X97DRAFT_323859 [Nemania serpens]
MATMLLSTYALPAFYNITTGIIRDSGGHDVNPHHPLPTAANVETQNTAATNLTTMKEEECDKDKCQDCIRHCGGLGNFSCFYFQCMNTECKGCKDWTSE